MLAQPCDDPLLHSRHTVWYFLFWGSRLAKPSLLCRHGSSMLQTSTANGLILVEGAQCAAGAIGGLAGRRRRFHTR